MIFYLLLVSIGLTTFWVYFIIFLKRKTFFNLNRWFLLTSLLFSFFAPFCQTLIPKPSRNAVENIIHQSPITNVIVEKTEFISQEVEQTFSSLEYNYSLWIVVAYFTGFAVFLLRFLTGIFKIVMLYRKGSYRVLQKRRVYEHDFIDQPFSLFRSIHVPKSWHMKIPKEILDHEKEHIKQWHFIDILIIEVAAVFLWFNPIVYLYKRAIRLNMEYLADRSVISQGGDLLNYQSMLVSMALIKNNYSTLTINFTTPLKTRIEMMTKKNSKPWAKFSLLGIIPAAAMLMALSTREELKMPIKESIASSGLLIEFNDKPEGLPIQRGQLIKISSKYGMQAHPVKKEEVFHNGIDLVAKLGTPVYATASGTVSEAKYNEDYGYFVTLNHSEEYQTKYSHLKNFVVMKGALIIKGQLIGYVGNSGKSIAPHLHYEVHESGEPANPDKFMNLDDC
ncbi:MAG: M23/M56 family metallopeptidase [Fulvivirga sp.]